MPYVVTQSCCSDASCVLACPVNCIHPAPGEPGFAEAEMVYIDADSCVGCGACVSACPVGAILPDTRLSAAQRAFETLAVEYYEAFPHAQRTIVAMVAPQRRLLRRGPFRVAIIGSGPAGHYTADELLKHPEVSVEVLERLEVPHGLARYGVAPDHPRTREVARLFEQIADQPGFTYRFGVDVGGPAGPSLAELEATYDAVVYAVGAASDRRLGIPGEDLAGSIAATALVGWYNGHPDHVGLDPPLRTERAIVIGTGNVALDVARMLTADPERLQSTDIDRGALSALRGSEIREVVLLGRRGFANAAFTTPELVGLVGLDDVDVLVDQPRSPRDRAGDFDGVRGRLFDELATRRPRRGRRQIRLRFNAVADEILGDDRVDGVLLHSSAADPTDACEVLDAGLVVRSIGYRGTPAPDLACDALTGTVVNAAGRVRAGVYVVGWAKRGPSGFLGTNKACAEETVEAILDDLDIGAGSSSARPLRSYAVR